MKPASCHARRDGLTVENTMFISSCEFLLIEPGTDMNRIYSIALITAAVAIATVAVSGCAVPFGGTTPTPAPTVYGPIPSPTPTPTPAPTSGPALAHSKPSDKIVFMTAPYDHQVVTFGRTVDGLQYENISLVVENTDVQPALNVVLSVTITDANYMNTNPLAYQQFPVGDLGRGERKPITLTTDNHNYCNLIKMTLTAQWGAHGEYYSNVPYTDIYSNYF